MKESGEVAKWRSGRRYMFNRGLSLAELLLAGSLAAVVIMAAVKVDQLNRRQTFGTADVASQQHRARVALQHMRERIGWGAKTDRLWGGADRPWGGVVGMSSTSTDTDLRLCEYRSTSAAPSDLNNLANYKKIRYRFVASDKKLEFYDPNAGCVAYSSGWGSAETLVEGVEDVKFTQPLGSHTIRVVITVNSAQQLYEATDIITRGRAAAKPTDPSLADGWGS